MSTTIARRWIDRGSFDTVVSEELLIVDFDFSFSVEFLQLPKTKLPTTQVASSASRISARRLRGIFRNLHFLFEYKFVTNRTEACQSNASIACKKAEQDPNFERENVRQNRELRMKCFRWNSSCKRE
jgi:hypothetical protein